MTLNAVQEIMLNPMTTIGDIIYSSTGVGLPTRLPIGAEGESLIVSSGIPAWGPSGSNTLAINQVAHGLFKDEFIFESSGTWAVAGNGAQSTAASAIVFSVEGANDFTLLFGGKHTFEAGTLDEDSNNLTAGWYVTGTGGDLQDPTGASGIPDNWQLSVFMANATEGYVAFHQPLDLTGDDNLITGVAGLLHEVVIYDLPGRDVRGCGVIIDDANQNMSLVNNISMLGNLTCVGFANFGTTTLAAAAGDIAWGLTGVAEWDFDQSDNELTWRNAAGTITGVLDAEQQTIYHLEIVTPTTPITNHGGYFVRTDGVTTKPSFIKDDGVIVDLIGTETFLTLTDVTGPYVANQLWTTNPGATGMITSTATLNAAGDFTTPTFANIGTGAEAVAAGDWSVGLTGAAARMFYDQSTSILNGRNLAGTETVSLNAEEQNIAFLEDVTPATPVTNFGVYFVRTNGASTKPSFMRDDGTIVDLDGGGTTTFLGLTDVTGPYVANQLWTTNPGATGMITSVATLNAAGDFATPTFANIGTTTEAVAAGDFAFGLTGSAARGFWDQSTSILNFRNTGGTETVIINATEQNIAFLEDTIPATPATNFGIYFVRADGATTKPSYMGDDGVIIDLTGAGTDPVFDSVKIDDTTERAFQIHEGTINAADEHIFKTGASDSWQTTSTASRIITLFTFDTDDQAVLIEFWLSAKNVTSDESFGTRYYATAHRISSVLFEIGNLVTDTVSAQGAFVSPTVAMDNTSANNVRVFISAGDTDTTNWSLRSHITFVE